jgi:hypothetical protein
VAYAWFNYGDFASIAGSSNWGYLRLDGVDPIKATYTNGNLPVCAYPCPVPPGTSFPNIRNGTYKSWNVLTVVTDASGVNFTNALAMVTATEARVDEFIPDFVPFTQLRFYRSHYLQSGVAPNNGLGGQKESGGDVGGCIEPVGPPPGVLNCRQ